MARDRRRMAVAACGLLVILAVHARAQRGADLPRLTQPVNDFAKIVDASSAAEIDRRIRVLQRATGDAIVVATVDTFAPYGTIDEYAVKLFEHAGIGGRGRDNGALVVVAVQERRVRIEVGYGLEEYITDGFAGETRDLMLSSFRRGAYGEGLLAGVTRLINRVAERRGVNLEEVPREPSGGQSGLPTPQIFILLLILFFILSSVFRRRPRRRYWGRGPWSGWNSGVGPFGGGSFGGGFGGFGGGGGGGFGGFGGGRSGGGGASGGW